MLFLFVYRNHPIVIRHVQATVAKSLKKDAISSVERRLFFKTAHVYFRAGCPLLALEVLSKLPEFYYEDSPDSVHTVQENGKTTQPPQLVTEVDWSDTGIRINGIKEEDELKLDWDEDEEDEDDKGSVLSFSKITSRAASRRASIASDSADLYKKADIMAQQLKFIAGLKILMEELETLASGSEPDGGQLRYILYMWLEKEVEILKLYGKFD